MTPNVVDQAGDHENTTGAPDSRLAQLAERCGIEAAFIDAHGNRRQTPELTLRALLGAMGIAAADAAAVDAALLDLDAVEWNRALPSAVVAAPQTLDVPVVLAQRTREVRWELTREDGTQTNGVAMFGELPLAESAVRDGVVLERRRLRLPADTPCGYHRLRIGQSNVDLRLIVTPGRCWLPDAIIAGERVSGIALQLYLLRSATNWGIGDYTDLRSVTQQIAARGGDVVGLNPLHALFPDEPRAASPYSPLSRLLLNVLNIDVTAIPEFDRSAAVRERVDDPAFAAALDRCRGAEFVDYVGVARCKLEILGLLFDEFRASAEPERRAASSAFRDQASPAVARTFVFAALRAHFAARDPAHAAWQHWPHEYRDPASPAVAAFARDHAAEVDYAAWLQWVADDQLAVAARAAQPMRVGLYRDLAVGADPTGAETWTNARAVVDAARVGAPPDIYNPQGQNWGLPPFDPQALRDEGYASFIELVRANMRHAGGLRIDHVMALAHLYWIPGDATPDAGGYVRYPLDDLIGIIALESHRARCLVVGEDLGTVPDGLRERLAAANILSYRVLFFEHDAAARFIAPADYPRASLAVLGSHDLPTLRAWWSAGDVRLRARLGLFADDAASQAQLDARDGERAGFVTALRAARVLGTGQALTADTLFTTAHAFLAQTSSALAVAQLDDIADESDPVNVPTTSDQYPNWRRRTGLTVEDLADDPRVTAWFALAGAAGRLRTPLGAARYPSGSASDAQA